MIYFDTLECLNTLKAGGFSEQQANAFVQVQKKSLSESLDTTLATKADIQDVRAEIQEVRTELKYEIHEIRSDIKLLRWMIGFVFAGVAAQILERFF